jgi:hypothetical protein
MLQLLKSIKRIIKPNILVDIQIKSRAEEYAHLLDSLIDDRDDDLAKILLPVKSFLLEISNGKFKS